MPSFTCFKVTDSDLIDMSNPPIKFVTFYKSRTKVQRARLEERGQNLQVLQSWNPQTQFRVA